MAFLTLETYTIHMLSIDKIEKRFKDLERKINKVETEQRRIKTEAAYIKTKIK